MSKSDSTLLKAKAKAEAASAISNQPNAPRPRRKSVRNARGRR